MSLSSSTVPSTPTPSEVAIVQRSEETARRKTSRVASERSYVPRRSQEKSPSTWERAVHRSGFWHSGRGVQDFLAYLAANPEEVKDRAGGIPHETLPNVMKIPLSCSGGEFALIDSDDYQLVKRYVWRLQSGYAAACCRRPSSGVVYMHRLVLLMLGKSHDVDHKSRQKLDNRKENLRRCTRSENQFNTPIPSNNTSGVKGVFVAKGGWVTGVAVDGKLHRERFSDFESAVQWVKRTRERLHGEFACHE